MRVLKIQYVLISILILSILLFFAHTYHTRTAIFADGKFYYSITRSIVKDADIDFENEYNFLGIGVDRTRTGYVWNMYPPGTSFFWIPGFLLAEGFVNMINLTPFINLDTQGYSIIYQTATAASSIILSVLGILLLYKLVRKYFSEQISVLSVLALYLTTNLFFYVSVEQINSHAISFFIACVFIYYFFQNKEDKYYYLVLGIIGGVIGLVRTQDVAILLPPIIEMLKSTDIKRVLHNTMLIFIGFIIGFFPQLFFWQKIFGTIGSPYTHFGFDFLSPQFIHVLFNTKNGLFTATPTVLLALIGLVSIIRSRHKQELKNIATYALLYFILQIYMISAWSHYDQGGSYSIRMIISTYPLVVFGFTEIMNRLEKQLSHNKIFVLIIILGALNSANIIRYLLLY